jgi:hypothetical protein
VRHHRTAGTLGAAYRGIGVQTHDQRITEGSRLIEQADVTAVQQVETAAGCDEPATRAPYPGCDLECVGQRGRFGQPG